MDRLGSFLYSRAITVRNLGLGRASDWPFAAVAMSSNPADLRLIALQELE